MVRQSHRLYDGGTHTNSVAVFVGGDWLIRKSIESLQTNRRNLFVAVLEFMGNIFGSAARHRTTLHSLTNRDSGVLVALPHLGIKMNGRSNKVDMRSDMLWQMVTVASCG